MCVFGAMVRGELVDREYSLFNDTFLTPDYNWWPGVFWFECRCLFGQCFSSGLRTSTSELGLKQLGIRYLTQSTLYQDQVLVGWN